MQVLDGTVGQILAMTGDTLGGLDTNYTNPPDVQWPMTYPYITASILLPLTYPDYTAEVSSDTWVCHSRHHADDQNAHRLPCLTTRRLHAYSSKDEARCSRPENLSCPGHVCIVSMRDAEPPGLPDEICT